MAKFYGRQAEKALDRKYGHQWWLTKHKAGALLARMERRIYEKRKRLTDRLAPLAVAFTVSLIINTGIAIWRIYR